MGARFPDDLWGIEMGHHFETKRWRACDLVVRCSSVRVSADGSVQLIEVAI